MKIPGSVIRAEWRRRSISLLALAALVAIVVAAVAGALAGAHRTATSIDRFRAWAHASDGSFQLSDDAQRSDLTRRLHVSPVVDRTANRRLVNAFFQHRPITDIAIFSDPQNRFGRTVDRARVLEGRMPRRDEPNAIALDRLAADLLHVGPGAELSARTWSADDLSALGTGTSFPGFHGPALRLRVVGVVQTLEGLTANVQRASPSAFAGPGFIPGHPGLGVWPTAVFVRTKGGAADFRALGTQLSRQARYSSGLPATDVYQNAAQQAADDSASGLLVFAVAAAIAGAFVVGQAIQRHLLLGAVGLRQLVDLGMTRSQVAIVAAIPLLGATVLGCLVGVVGSALVSPLLPIGLAGQAEVEPGTRVEVPILAACALAGLLLVAVFTLVAGRSAVRRVRQPAPTRPRVPALVRLAATLGAPPAIGTGVHLATERRAPGGPIPVRSALVGVTLAVVAIVGATVVARSETAFAGEPARWGRTWHSEPDVFAQNVSQRMLAEKIGSVPGVSAVAEIESDTIRVEDRDTPVLALSPKRGRVDVALRRGRLPRRGDEIALGEGTLATAHARIGSTVRVRGHASGQPTAGRTMTVTGTIVIPPSAGDSGTLDLGAAVDTRTLHALVPADELSPNLVIRYRRGTDVAAIERRLKQEGLNFNPFTEPQVPGSVRRLSDVRTIAIALGWFFVVLAALGLLHALWVVSRRHRREFAVLRVLGMRHGQVGGAVVVAALLLGLGAAVIGVPIGVVLGRVVWRSSTESLHALTNPVTPWIVLVLAVPVTLAAAALLAWWPARWAAHTELGEPLRTE